MVLGGKKRGILFTKRGNYAQVFFLNLFCSINMDSSSKKTQKSKDAKLLATLEKFLNNNFAHQFGYGIEGRKYGCFNSMHALGGPIRL